MDVLGFLNQWQTLIGALLALAAAAWTIVVMNGQRHDETLRHREAQRRKKLAVRAAMPDALSDLTRYVEACSQRLVGLVTTLPELPIEAIATLKSAIEFIDNDASARTFELVSWYQVYRARMASNVPPVGSAEFPERAYDTALLLAYVNSLFDYARNEANEVSTGTPSRAEMISALRNAIGLVRYVQHEEFFEGTLETINRRHPVA